MCISDEEHLFELEIEEEEEGISGDQNWEEYHTNERCTRQCFHVSTRVDHFCFCFYFVQLHFQQLNFYILVHPRFHFEKNEFEFMFTFCYIDG